MKVLRRFAISSLMHERHLCFTEESELDYGIYSTFGCYGIYSTISVVTELLLGPWEMMQWLLCYCWGWPSRAASVISFGSDFCMLATFACLHDA